MRKWLILLILVLVIAGLGAWYWGWRSESKALYKTEKVTRGDVTQLVRATGTVNPVITVQVGSQVSGTIQKLFADFNSEVKEGEVIAQLDQDLFKAQMEQNRASLENAQRKFDNARAALEKERANLESTKARQEDVRAGLAKAEAQVGEAKTSLDRVLRLVQEGILAKSEEDTARAGWEVRVAELDAARAQLSAAAAQVKASEAQIRANRAEVAAYQSQVKQARASLRQAEVNLSRTVIRSPIDGVVISRNVDVGQTVAASLQAPTLFIIAKDLTKMQVETNVPEADISRVKPGQRTLFTVDAYPRRQFVGLVSEVRQAPVAIQNVVTYVTVVSVENQDLLLRPGMTADVSIEAVKREGVLRIPNAALRFRPQGLQAPPQGAGAEPRRSPDPSRRRVWVLSPEGKPKPVPIRMGLSEEQFTEVAAGKLREGDEVIVGLARPGEERASRSMPPGFGGPRHR